MSSYSNNTTTQVDFGTSRNPEVTIGADVSVPTMSVFTRTIYTRVQYSGENFFVLPPNKEEFSLVGQNSFFLYPLSDSVPTPSAVPSFVSKRSYNTTFAPSPSGFLTAQYSLMPKLMVPSQKIVDNGLKDSIQEGVFNWESVGEDETEEEKAKDRVSSDDAQSSVIFIKGLGDKVKKAKLSPNVSQVPSEMSDIDKNMTIGGGAFQMIISFLDTDLPGKALLDEGTAYPATGEGAGLSESPDDKIQPKVIIKLGNLQLSVDMDGKCVGSWLTGEKNTASVNLIDGTGEECLPQARAASTDKGQTFALTVYPLWDGVVIQSGVQTAKNIVSASAVYLPVIQKASLFQYAELKTRDNGTQVPFDPEDPDQIFIKTQLGAKSVIPDLGDSGSELFLEAHSCNCVAAFAPIYFTKEMKVVHTMSGNRAVNGYSYSYVGYPIWTDNGTDYHVASPITFQDSGLDGPAEFTCVMQSSDITLSSSSDRYQRRAGEMFGEIIAMQETIPVPSASVPPTYNNGITGWEDYITGVNITSDLDSSGGSITFDKYGATDGEGQNTRILQHVGKLSINLKGCYNTNGATDGDYNTETLFKGYSWTADEDVSNEGVSVTVNLAGVEKRLEDIQLINPPIFDGYKFVDVATYICEFAGVSYDFSNADSSIRLQMSTDPIESVCFNWTTGMGCRQALDLICKETAHGYLPLDGKIFFFQRGQDGIPNYRGKVWNGFTGVNIQSLNQNPDFDNLRNQIVLIGMRQVTEEAQKNFPSDFPLFPITTMVSNNTTPDIPWPKRLCYTLPGYPSQKELDVIADKIAAGSNYYEIMGTTTIPGANIKPLDVFLDYVVIGVRHNIDLVGKSWTTTLDLQVGK